MVPSVTDTSAAASPDGGPRGAATKNGIPYAIEAIGVTVVRARLTVLRDVNMAVELGGTVAVMGPNGAGKSTLLKCIAGAIRPTSGEVHLLGSQVTRSPFLRRQVGFVGHAGGLYANMTAMENVTFTGRMHGILRPGDRARELLAAAGLHRAADRLVRQLSQGARQRVAIVRALVQDPQLIVLDEPFASLDDQARLWLEHLFQRWRYTRATVCFTCHDVAQGRTLADQIVWLSNGAIESIEPAVCTPRMPSRSA
jgi:ABC-type multidrug transport system ATPase subunit